MTTIYLIRHAEAEGNLYRRIHGWYNSLITENGYRQIAALEDRFRDIQIDAVYSSDLFRTMTTARAVYGPRGLELRTDPGLREMNLGDWEDLPFGEARRRWPQEMERFNRSDPGWRAPNGEDFFQMGDRIEGAVRRIAQSHPGQTIALFSHGMVIRQLIARIRAVPPEQWHCVPHGDNTAVTRLSFDGEVFGLELELDNSHLPQDISTLARQMWWRKDQKKAKDVNLWFRPVVWAEDRDLFRCALDGESGLLAQAEEYAASGRAAAAMAGEHPAGVMLLDWDRYAARKAGYLPCVALLPERRGQGLGIQLVGQSVSLFRERGFDRLCLPCLNDRARPFLQKHGFVKVGGENGLDLMEKYIGFAREGNVPPPGMVH